METDAAPLPTKSKAVAKAFQFELERVLARLFELLTPPASTWVISAVLLIWSPSP